MPIYEYRRPDGTTFEVIQKFSDDALTVDPETGVPVERVLSAPAIHFKGSGFHNTDYGTKRRNREQAAQSAGGEGGSGTTPAGEGGGKSDAPAPAKSEPASKSPAAASGD